jgi:hypothetical protein
MLSKYLVRYLLDLHFDPENEGNKVLQTTRLHGIMTSSSLFLCLSYHQVAAAYTCESAGRGTRIGYHGNE